MYDINFYQRAHELVKKLQNGGNLEPDYVYQMFSKFRNPTPVVYNIETTNACNMKCKMCPRTTMMTRPVETMNFETFSNIVDQIEPHSKSDWNA